MAVFILSFVVLLIIVAAMSIGVILANKPIKGSCGGMSALGIDTECEICGGDRSKCDNENNTAQKQLKKPATFYDASK